jgi:EAL domain-containing protein (putative c-di-GMP-specific phosphodiesterase class I)
MFFSSVDVAEAYNEASAALLQKLEPAVRAVVGPLTEQFYDALERSGPICELVACLEPMDFLRLKTRQVEYLAMLASPSLTMTHHQAQAREAGRTHALVGVDIQWLIEALTFFQQGIQSVLGSILTLEERETAVRIIGLRVLFDLHEQVAGYRLVSREVGAITSEIDRHVMANANLADLTRDAFAAMAGLPGGVSGFLARADADGQLQIEAEFGVADRYHQAMEQGRIPKISTDPNIPAGQGPGGRAWRSGQIVISNSWMLEPDRIPWRAAGAELGFRSCAAVPLVDECGQVIALIMLYGSYPALFSTNRSAKFIAHIGQLFGHAILRNIHAPVVALSERIRYRHLLTRHRVTLHYQPIINLRDGSLSKLEALARLDGNDGALILPADFLPALGDVELMQLFEEVVRQASRDCILLENRGLTTRIAINIPAQALGDLRYLDVLLDALAEHSLATSRVSLEILETPSDPGDPTRHDEFLRRLRDVGIDIEQDDLGSGHSSLLRFDRYPFDGVKIDRELIRSSLRNPHRALEFVLYLTRLAHALQTPITVEGLETFGIVEAAAILGADFGQGFCLANPMPVSEIVAWHRTFVYNVNPQEPRTALGAMAGYLIRDIWDLQRASSIVEHFVAASGLHGSPLSALLQNSRTLAAEGGHDDAYQRTRTQIIDALRDHWLAHNSV